VHVLADAWARVGNPRRFRDVARELTRVPYRGVNGAYYLNGESHCALSYPDTTRDPSLGQAHLVLQIRDGRSRVLAPALYAEAAFRTPSWVGREAGPLRG
jgi:branched-chain amino acid transport system substrate-binding protein